LREIIADLQEPLEKETDFLPITTKAYLYLSGTPFKALSTGEFIEEQIFNWTYTDEQRAKEEFSVKHPGKRNPYGALPQMRLLTYQMPDELLAIASTGEFDEFDLNSFFEASGTEKNAQFKHKDDVQKWLDIIRGGYSAKSTEYLKTGTRPPFPYSDVRLLPYLQHSFWFMPNVATCHAMANLLEGKKNIAITSILSRVKSFRQSSEAPSTRSHADTPHRFIQMSAKNGGRAIVIPRVSSENRPFLPVDFFQAGPIIGDKCYAIYDEPLWNLALIASKMHIVWIGTVCSRLRTDFSYGNKLGWNTFPIPQLTDKNKADLTRCAEEILLAREAHFPATIADMYHPETMPANLREAHERNDEVLERIYIRRRFRKATERVE